MMITVPKLRVTGDVRNTVVFTDAISGFEPATLSYQGKEYKGTKLYVGGKWFKVFADPVKLGAAISAAKLQHIHTKALPLTSIPDHILNAPEAEVKMISSKHGYHKHGHHKLLSSGK